MNKERHPLLKRDDDISDEERARRIQAAMREVAELRQNPKTPRHAYWLSFADSALPEGQQFLGAIIVDDCVNMADAIGQAHAAKVNPGGSVAGYLLFERTIEKSPALQACPRLTLMNKAELLARGLIEVKEQES